MSPCSSSYRQIRSIRALADCDCPGIPLAWDPDDPMAVFTKYPWNCHGIQDKPLSFQFPTAVYDGDDIIDFDIHSTICLRCLDSGAACFQCKKLAPKIEKLWQLSKQPPG